MIGIIEFPSHLLDASPPRDDHPRNQERIALRPAGLKLPPRLGDQFRTPWRARIVAPVERPGRAQDVGVEAQSLRAGCGQPQAIRGGPQSRDYYPQGQYIYYIYLMGQDDWAGRVGVGERRKNTMWAGMGVLAQLLVI